jgi:TPR repeat protein
MAILSYLLSLFTGAQSQTDTGAGIEAYKRGDYQVALAQLEKAASRGDAQAHYNLGVLYAEGRAVAKDQAKAVQFYQRGAENGSILAAYSLAQAYRKGEGVSADYSVAASWFRFAAQRGDFRAGNELGLLYVEGKGVKQDLIEGFAWIYPATHATIMDQAALANAMQLASMLSREEIQTAQAKGQDYFRRYIEPNRYVVEALLPD